MPPLNQTPSQEPAPQPQAAPSPAPETVTPVNPATVGDASFPYFKLSLGVLLLSSVLSTLVSLYLPATNVVFLLVFVASLIYTFQIASDLKTEPSEENKKKAAITLGLTLVLSAAVYFYKLRSTNHELANKINNLSWQIFGCAILLYIVLNAVTAAIA